MECNLKRKLGLTTQMVKKWTAASMNCGSDLEKELELQFFTPPTSCEVSELGTNKSPLKFPITEAISKKTVDDIITTLTPQVMLRRTGQPFAMNSVNRISAYDNVGNSRPTSYRRFNTSS